MKISCIIPTFARSESILQDTINSILELKEESFSNITEIIIIDQNAYPLDLSKASFQVPSKKQITYTREYYLHLDKIKNKKHQSSESTIHLYHLYGLNPSVTIAKNYAINHLAKEELIQFFDDDVIVKKGTINIHLEYQKQNPKLGMLGGRETIDPPKLGQSPFRKALSFIANYLLSFENNHDQDYKFKNTYVGKITPYSYLLCNFDLQTNELVKVDTVRGCNASLKKEAFIKSGGFDEAFQGTALREETDFCLRILQNGYQNYFIGKAGVLHRRNLGGCHNLGKTYQTFISKLENEKYFQIKHFSHVSSIHFLIRLLPLILESMRHTFAIAPLLGIHFTIILAKEKRNITKERASSLGNPSQNT